MTPDEVPDGHGRIEELVAAGRLAPPDAEVVHAALDAAGRRGASAGYRLLSLWLMVAVASGCAFLALAVPYSLRRFMAMFTEMETKEGLPCLTSLLGSVPGFVYSLVFLLAAGGLFAKEYLISEKRVTLVINAIAGLGLLLFVMAYVAALFLPLFAMMQMLSEAAGG